MTPQPGTPEGRDPSHDRDLVGDDELSADEARVRDLLRAAADVGPMPDDVVARLDAALAATATTTAVASLDARRRARVRRVQRVFATAAGIAVLAVGGTALVEADPMSGGGAGSSADSAASGVVVQDLPATAQLLRSGKDLSNVAAVTDVAEDVVAGAPAAARAQEAAPDGSEGLEDAGPNMLAAPADPAPSSDVPLPASGDAATPAEDQREVAEHVVACTGVDPASVVAVEIATAGSEPAALVVHRTAEGAEGLVVPLDCTAGTEVLTRVEVPAP